MSRDLGATFDRVHRDSADPWDGSGWYERRKRHVLVSALPAERYGSCFQPGCSVGALTAALTERCASVLAVDASAEALRIAGAALDGLPGVRLARMEVPEQWPTERFDLVVIAEFAYYLPPAALPVLVDRAVGALRPGGDLVVEHYLGEIEGYELDAVDVHDAFAAAGLPRMVDHRDERFTLQVYRR